MCDLTHNFFIKCQMKNGVWRKVQMYMYKEKLGKDPKKID